MTTYLLAAVVLVGLVGALNLVLTFGVIRRLREHDRALASHPAATRPAGRALSPGMTVADFTAVTVDGAPLTRAQLTGRTAVGFFSTTCAPCLERFPEFVDYARAFAGGRDRVLIVVVAERAEDAEDFVDRADAVARVVLERYDGPVASAFAVDSFPALLVVDDGTVVTTGSTLDTLPAATLR
ncbi:TlpA disulfide reductase family protein [Planomonospora sp. ID82291]|uniref:TlpA family protein disulfide reductase n=1 Tax=Planomonospora sp. ID82291 TaxID=2738136 RepID=UPI0018C380D1|nr:TlpA disulfide reductase family protein [Planomonospora sp. ID82291]MBG0816726.1 TlpA family protein disulfide reductase [Planomonospora sp. ID82291]